MILNFIYKIIKKDGEEIKYMECSCMGCFREYCGLGDFKSDGGHMMKMKNSKHVFIDLKYKPRGDLVCLFKINPNKISLEKAANTVALESSVGTWTGVSKGKADYVEKIKARVFSIKKKWFCKNCLPF